MVGLLLLLLLLLFCAPLSMLSVCGQVEGYVHRSRRR